MFVFVFITIVIKVSSKYPTKCYRIVLDIYIKLVYYNISPILGALLLCFYQNVQFTVCFLVWLFTGIPRTNAGGFGV